MTNNSVSVYFDNEKNDNVKTIFVKKKIIIAAIKILK